MSSVSAQTYLQMKAQLKEETKQRQILEKKYEECQSKLERMCDASEDQIEKAKVLVNQVAKLRTSMSTSIPKDTHETLKNEFKKLKVQNQKIASEKVALHEQNQKIETECHKAQEEVLDCQGELVKVKKKLERYQKAASKSTNTQQLEHKLKFLENTIQVKETELQRKSKKYETDLENLRNTCRDAKTESEKFRRALENEVAKQKETEREVEKLREKIKCLTEELEESESQVLKMGKRLHETQSQQEKDERISILEAKIDDYKKEIEGHNTALEEANLRFSERLRAKEEEVNRLLLENQSFNEEAEIMSEHGSYISGKSMSDLESEVTELKEQNSDLNFQFEKEKILHRAAKHNFDSDLGIDTDMDDYEIIECLNRKLLEKKLENQILHDKVRQMKVSKSVQFEDGSEERNLAREKFNKLKGLFEEKLKMQLDQRNKIETDLEKLKEKYRNLERASQLRIDELEEELRNHSHRRNISKDPFEDFAYGDLKERYNKLKQKLKMSLSNEEKLRQHILKLRNRIIEDENEY